MDFPILSIALAYLLAFLSKIPVGVAQNRQPGGYDNQHPRDQQAQLVGWGKRALGAHQNSFEAFAPFAAAVLSAKLMQANPIWLTRLCTVFLLARVLYIILYLANRDRIRSLIWGVGFGTTLGIFSLAIF